MLDVLADTPVIARVSRRVLIFRYQGHASGDARQRNR